MPFPLAHPVAALPFKRYCPRYLSFPALVVGSLVPDLGYYFRAGEFTHNLIPGGVVFDLPAALCILVVFQVARRLLISRLPPRWQHMLAMPRGSWRHNCVAIPLSALIGVWTHLFLDSMTHADGWLVLHIHLLQRGFALGAEHEYSFYDALYVAWTFFGVAAIGGFYLAGLNKELKAPCLRRRTTRFAWAGLFASMILVIALLGRGVHPALGNVAQGLATLAMMLVFFIGVPVCISSVAAPADARGETAAALNLRALPRKS